MEYLKYQTSGCSSPWVELVNGAVHSHRDHQGLLTAPLSHPVDDTSQSCSAHMSGTRGNALTDQMHNITVQF